MKPELISVTLSACYTVYYLTVAWEPVKGLYWFGATLLTLALCLMRG